MLHQLPHRSSDELDAQLLRSPLQLPYRSRPVLHVFVGLKVDDVREPEAGQGADVGCGAGLRTADQVGRHLVEVQAYKG